MHDTPAPRIPMWRAATASTAVLMPTASAPSTRSMRISAGDSNCGPVSWQYTPSFSGMAHRAAVSRMMPASSSSYTRLISGKRGPRSSRFGPISGEGTKQVIWSRRSIRSPACIV